MNLKKLTFALIVMTAAPCHADSSSCDAAANTLSGIKTLMPYANDSITNSHIQLRLSDLQREIEECGERVEELEKMEEQVKSEKALREIEALRKRLTGR